MIMIKNCHFGICMIIVVVFSSFQHINYCQWHCFSELAQAIIQAVKWKKKQATILYIYKVEIQKSSFHVHHGNGTGKRKVHYQQKRRSKPCFPWVLFTAFIVEQTPSSFGDAQRQNVQRSFQQKTTFQQDSEDSPTPTLQTTQRRCSQTDNESRHQKMHRWSKAHPLYIHRRTLQTMRQRIGLHHQRSHIKAAHLQHSHHSAELEENWHHHFRRQ